MSESKADPGRASTADVPVWLPASILALGFAFRLAGLYFGLPQQLDPDERISVTAAGRMLGGESLLDPGWYGWPGYTLHMLLAFSYAGFAAVQVLFGGFDSLSDLEILYYESPDALFVIGRFWGAVSGTACILVTYLLAGRCMSQPWAVVAAIIVAVSPEMVSFSMLTRPDMLQIFFMLLVIFFSMNAVQTPRHMRRYFFLAGICLGLATASKYPGLLAVVAILCAAMLLPDVRLRDRLNVLIIAATASVAAVFVSAPYLLLNFSGVLEDVVREGRDFHLSATSHGLAWALYNYLADALPRATTLPIAWTGYVGVLALFINGAFSSRARHLLIIPIVAMAYLLFIASLNLYWDRWALPLIPLVAIGFAYLAHLAYPHLAKRLPDRSAAALAAVALALVVLPMASATAKDVKMRAQNLDPRVQAYAWVIKHLPLGSRVLLDPYTPQLSVDEFEVLVARDGKIIDWADSERAKRPPGFFVGIGAGLSPLTQRTAADALQAANVDYVLLSGLYRRYRAEAASSAENLGAHRIVRTYDAILAVTEEVHRFEGTDIRVLRFRAPETRP